MAIREKTSVIIKVKGEGASHSRIDVSVRDLVTTIDEPAARGGTNLGPAPTETAVAALAGCTNTIGNKCAKALDIDAGLINVEIECDFDRRGVLLKEEIDVPFTAIRQSVTCSGSASAAELERLGEEVAKFCPLSKLFEGAGAKVETTWSKA